MAPNIVTLTHEYMHRWLHPGQIALDGTVGQGFDTLALCQCVGEHGHVYGFDIQPQAIAQTEARLTAHGIPSARFTLYPYGHEHLNEQLPAGKLIDFAIFNLGYLPHGDKTIITTPQTTLAAMAQLLPRLSPAGHVLIAAYIGHPGGRDEYEALASELSTLDQQAFSVGRFEFINQKHLPPKLLIVERRADHDS